MSGPVKDAGETPLFAWAATAREERVRVRRRSRHVVIGSVGFALLTSTAVSPPAPLLLWNGSPSVAEGLYAVRPTGRIAVGDMVVARLPRRVSTFAIRRGYVGAGVPLIKPVVAVAGQLVCARGDVLLIDGRRVARRAATDSRGRALPRWQGCRRLGKGQLFLLSAHPQSFDGRYFGPSSASDLVGRAVLLWAR